MTSVRRFAHRTVAVLIALLLALTGLSTLKPQAAHAEETPVTTGALTWGMKASWRTYVGKTILSPEVTQTDAGEYVFPLVSGGYDPETGATALEFDGTVQWQGHWFPDEGGVSIPDGYQGPTEIYILDVTMTRPSITINADEATLSADVVSRDVSTWQLRDYGRIVMATLNIDDIDPVVQNGSVNWSAIPAFISRPAATGVFGGSYKTGQSVDPVSIDYHGQGGSPVYDERWTAPNTPTVALDDSGMATLDTSWTTWWTDAEAGIVHRRKSVLDASGQSYVFQAYSLTELKDVGEPLVLPREEGSSLAKTAFFVDADTHRAYFRSGAKGTPLDLWVQWDPATQSYSRGTDAQFAPRGDAGTLIWDQERHTAYTLSLDIPDGVAADDPDNMVWHLNQYAQQGDGSYTEQRYPLPSGPKGWNLRWYPVDGANSASVASDGSIILTRRAGISPFGTDPAPVDQFDVQRISIADGTATVTEIPGTDVGSRTSTGFTKVLTGANGLAVLARTATASRTAMVQFVRLGTDGTARVADPVEVPDTLLTEFALDDQEATAWAVASSSQHLAAIRETGVISDDYFATVHPRAAGVLIGPDRAVYALSGDGTPYSTGQPLWFGFGRYAITGHSPAIETHPSSIVRNAAEGDTAMFTAAATGSPDPTVQWQQKEPGSQKFHDISSATEQTLSVPVTDDVNGVQYRAVFTNSAGALASDPATLTVLSAPGIVVAPGSITVTENGTAEFQIMPSGNPEPTITWETNAGDGWTSVAGDQFTVDGGYLTVTGVSREQDGTRFRVKLVNSVGTVYSDDAVLTVTAPPTIPEDGVTLDGVTLEWFGSEEIQGVPPAGGSNFFSAGTSDGTESGYRATDGDVSVIHRTADGTETPASWETRAVQTKEDADAVQLVRLGAGTATLAADGSGSIAWSGSFSVNFYGGMVPFTLTDPVLTLDERGGGTLTADLGGYASSQDNPGQKTPLAPVADVVIATFSGVTVDIEHGFTVTPDYQGVELSVPDDQTAQDRTGAGWGSWPQSWVDVHFLTGLSSYWYSSGGAADPHKAPAPFTVGFTDATTPQEPVTVAPTVTAQPQSVRVTAGADATFSAAADGTPTPSIQWQSLLPDGGDWNDIPGATETSYTATAVPESATGTEYRAVFANAAGQATTDPVTLAVTRAGAGTDSGNPGEPENTIATGVAGARLSNTGAEPGAPLAVAALVLLLGTAMVVVARRRSNARRGLAAGRINPEG
ncbi:hypothetical protein GCM10027416_19750 [Okibacterium endophyticum]